MSSSSRRKKEHAPGGAGKVSAEDKVAPISTMSKSAGKENSRPTTRRAAAQKRSNLNPISQIDELQSAAMEDPRVNKGASSAPRGRKSAPLPFSTKLPDTRRSSRVLARQPQIKANNSNERTNKRCNLERMGSEDLEIEDGEKLSEFQGVSQENKEIETQEGEIDGNGTEIGEVKVTQDLVNYPENAKKKIRIGSFDAEKTNGNLSTITLKSKGSEGMKLRSTGVGAEGESSLRHSKSESRDTAKLHQKLAFLDEKVKRIASCIKETKDMLDMESMEHSEAILSDVRHRVTGIEKAIGAFSDDGDTVMGTAKSDENDDMEKFDDNKSLVKNTEEAGGLLSGDLMNMDKRRVISSNVAAVPDADVCEILEADNSRTMLGEKDDLYAFLTADEKLSDFNDEDDVLEPEEEEEEEEFEENPTYQLNDIGLKPSTAGWFVSEGESVVLAHDDGSCSFYDIVNCEVKAEYKPPLGVSSSTWRDCWVIHAPGGDGCAGKHVVVASAGNAVDPGFCSWDFYTKDVNCFHIDDGISTPSRTALAPLSNDPIYRTTPPSAENHQWWYKPCGPLIASAASWQKTAQIYDIRDGERLVKWELSKPVVPMDYSSPLHWKSNGKVATAGSDGISLWDVCSPTSLALQTVSSSGQKISALHINNSDSGYGGGVRRRISAAEAEGNDGVFCTPNSIVVLDFRQSSGVGLRIAKPRQSVQSVMSYGDSVYVGCSSSTAGKHEIQVYSVRKHKLVSTYQLPETNAHDSFSALTQVWGNSSVVMGACGLGLFVFDALKDEKAKEVMGGDDMYCPSFDYAGSRVLLVSRDHRPACWRYLFV
ncbi:KIN14B-interacting protein At4g14310-like [Andrographis paniculata]|uniref:KIN14B-interacting protein At4g14310-like n=1 Tax=Andrographis paniculata TaxID=175694 RepID=UPI0021E84EEE|nr:KIN14B-interacting protein At4g14310-like [Andrographis paniculata]